MIVRTLATGTVTGFVLIATVIGSWSSHAPGFRLANGETARKHLPATVPGGFAVFDYDGDGKLDLFFANGGELPSGRKTSSVHHNKLLRNTGGMKFEDVTERAGLAGFGYNFGAAAGDYNGDGRPDLLVPGLRNVTLYRNNADGTFTDVTREAGIDNQNRWSVAAAWIDIENDGDLDLFVVNYLKWDPATERECITGGKPDFCHPRFYEPVPNALFRNNGNGTFTDISDVSGVGSKKGKGMSASVADFDRDGLADIYVTNDRVFAFLFLNRGNGKFEEDAFGWGVAVPESGNPVSGMGTDAQDFNNDGRPDLILTALRDETFPLFRNSGKELHEVTAATSLGVLSRSMSGWGVVFADLDNDGWKDVVVSCSDALSPEGGRGDAARERPVWFRNTGNGKFVRGTGWDSLPRAMYRGALAADMDDDGCLDVITTQLNGEAQILRNPCATKGNWLKVDVSVPGARVRIGEQQRHVTTAAGYSSSYAGPLHFGGGALKSVDVEVIFPDGKQKNIQTPVNRTVRIVP